MALFLSVIQSVHATDADTLRVMDIDEVRVVAQPKQWGRLRKQSVAATAMSDVELQNTHTTSLKELSGYVPNFFMPDYGSHLTGAVYIRGVGSRINSPAVGLYVDHAPMVEKSAYDLDLLDVERVDVLRGPQGTLYGSNTMGGLICLYTKNPLSYQGTDVQLSGSNKDNKGRVEFVHHQRWNDRWGFSLGGFYENKRGMYRNTYRNAWQDQGQSAGGKLRVVGMLTSHLMADLNLRYQYTNEDAYPYYYAGVAGTTAAESLDSLKERISNNRNSGYRRNLFTGALRFVYEGDWGVLTSITGYQHLTDRMQFDQDCLPGDYFTLTDRQHSNTVTEELVWKNKDTRKWMGSTGLFFSKQWLHTNAPVYFESDGVAMLEQTINQNFTSVIPASMANTLSMNFAFADRSLPVPGSFDTPTTDYAIFHQSTFKDVLTHGLSVTVGLRAELQRLAIRYNTGCDVASRTAMTMNSMHATINVDANSNVWYRGSTHKDYTQLLPKLAIQYDITPRTNLYATVSKGYRSGGYNIQMFSDIISYALRQQMLTDIKAAYPDAVDKFAAENPAMPARVVSMIKAMGDNIPEGKTLYSDVSSVISYKPEYSWNFEVGAHFAHPNRRLQGDIALFYMDIENQQVAKFAGNTGYGRTMANAGRGESYGVELSGQWVIPALYTTLTAGYGYTHATFREYTDSVSVTDESGTHTREVSYKRKRTPFVPQHTVSVGLEFSRPLQHTLFTRAFCGVNATGAGKVYWTEANDWGQDFYVTLGAHAGMELKHVVTVELWGKNLTNSHYDTFGFESSITGTTRRFAQYGKPLQVGVDIKFSF
jgi:outer membrane receptor protein involved in Fe transport